MHLKRMRPTPGVVVVALLASVSVAHAASELTRTVLAVETKKPLPDVVVTATSPAPRGEFPGRPEAARAHIIPLTQGRAYLSRFKDTRNELYRRIPGLKEQLDIPSSESFSREAIAALLEQRDSTGQPSAGIRIYSGLDPAGLVRLILVSYDSRGNNIIGQLSPAMGASAGLASDGEVIEEGQRCPPTCPDEEDSLAARQEVSAPEAVSNHIIPVRDAADYTARFRSTWNQLSTQLPELSARLNFTRAQNFNRDAIAALLNQRAGDGDLAAGIRIHFGLDAEGQVHLVLTPRDARGKEIIGRLSGSPSTGYALSGDGEVIEDGIRCPPSCPPTEDILD